LHSKRTCTEAAWSELNSKNISKDETDKIMLHEGAFRNDVEGDNIGSMREIFVSINDNFSSFSFLFEPHISRIYHLNKFFSILLLSLMNKFIAYLIFEQFKW